MNVDLSKYAEACNLVEESELRHIAVAIQTRLNKRQRIFVGGNGGSLSIAQHFASDMVKGAGDLQPVIQQVIVLMDNQVMTTAIANDKGYDYSMVFPLCCSGADKDDLIILFSVSGTSKNIQKVREYADLKGIELILITGNAVPSHKKEYHIIVKTHSEDEERFAVCEGVFSCICHEVGMSVRQYIRDNL